MFSSRLFRFLLVLVCSQICFFLVLTRNGAISGTIRNEAQREDKRILLRSVRNRSGFRIEKAANEKKKDNPPSPSRPVSNRNGFPTEKVAKEKKKDEPSFFYGKIRWGLTDLYEQIVGVSKPKKGSNKDITQRIHAIRDELLAAAGVEKDSNGTKKNAAHAARTNSTMLQHHALAKPPPDQPIDFLVPILPPPKIAAQQRAKKEKITTIVFVPSHQGSFMKRQAIRETWMAAAKRHNTTTTVEVVFVVARSVCSEFESDLTDHEDAVAVKKIAAAAHPKNVSCNEFDGNFLKAEQERYQDLLEIPMKEEYKRLPEKMVQAYNWALKNVPTVKWIAKADDDMFVNVRNLEQYVRKYDSSVPIVIGDIIPHSKVNKGGKWAEHNYDHKFYPYWPKGSAGHVLSRAVLDYITTNSESLYRYQGEDTSIGIWLDEASKSGRLPGVIYIHAPKSFVSRGAKECITEDNIIIVGHDFQLRAHVFCQNKADNQGPLTTSWVDSPSNFQQLIRKEETGSRKRKTEVKKPTRKGWFW